MIIKNNIHNIYMDNKNFRRVSDTNPIIRANYAKLFPRPRTDYFVEELRRRNREKERENMSKEDFKLIITKGIYPYEYMDSFDKFNEQQLPSIDKFYSSLNDDTISKNDYEHALKV